MTEILFIKTSSLGDVVHQMPAVTDAARRHPHARLSWVVEEAFAPLALLHPAVAEVIPVATRRWRRQAYRPEIWREVGETRARLRATSYDRIVDTQGLIRSAIIARIARGERHGYDAGSIREPAASLFYDVTHRVSRASHAVGRNRALTAMALGHEVGAEIDYGVLRPTHTSSHEVILLHGTSRTSKEWSEANWQGLGDWLQRRGFDVLLPWGTEAERARSERLAAAIPHSRVVDRQPLDHVAQLIAGAAFVIGVDTGLLHLAAAYQTPLLGIYCATDPALTGPVGNGRIQVTGGKRGAPSLEQVVTAAEQLLV
jgi:heptosyltransferase-1